MSEMWPKAKTDEMRKDERVLRKKKENMKGLTTVCVTNGAGHCAVGAPFLCKSMQIQHQQTKADQEVGIENE